MTEGKARLAPERSVGITDLIAYRDCPRRASYGLRRHTGLGTQDPGLRTPEAGSRAAAYGSAVHEAIAALEEGHDDAQAIQRAWDQWGHWLQPADLQLLHDDIENFHRRDFKNVRTVLAEDEIRVPLMLLDGELAYFRGRIDRLYERLDAPGHFIHVDYKSSRWAKSEAQVNGIPDDNGHVDDAALQMWAYNWSIHEALPEVEDLLQIYDQLRYGQIPVRKSDAQRQQMREWLIAQMTTFFADEDYQADGLLKPRKNEWCPWCPILESCPIVHQLSHFALASIAALNEEFEGPAIDSYAEEYGMAKDAMKVLKRFVESMNGIVRELPAARREQLGFKVIDRKNTIFTARALEQLAERIGWESLLQLVSLPKSRLESLDDEDREWALSLMEPTTPTSVITRRNPAT